MHVILDTIHGQALGPLAFQRATLKSWEWPGDEATYTALYLHCTYTVHVRTVYVLANCTWSEPTNEVVLRVKVAGTGPRGWRLSVRLN